MQEFSPIDSDPLGRRVDTLLASIAVFDGAERRSQEGYRQFQHALQNLLTYCEDADDPVSAQVQGILAPLAHVTGWSRERLSGLHSEFQFVVPVVEN